MYIACNSIGDWAVRDSLLEAASHCAPNRADTHIIAVSSIPADLARRCGGVTYEGRIIWYPTGTITEWEPSWIPTTIAIIILDAKRTGAIE